MTHPGEITGQREEKPVSKYARKVARQRFDGLRTYREMHPTYEEQNEDFDRRHPNNSSVEKTLSLLRDKP